MKVIFGKNTIRNKIGKMLFLFTFIPFFIFVTIFGYFYSDYVWNKKINETQLVLNRKMYLLNGQLDILLKYNEIVKNNLQISSMFMTEYDSIGDSLGVATEISAYFSNFYNSYNSQPTDVYVYHDNYSLPQTRYSVYIDNISDDTKNEVLQLKSNEYMWVDNEEHIILYSNFGGFNSDHNVILAFSIPKISLDTILEMPSVYSDTYYYDITISPQKPTDNSNYYCTGVLNNNQFLSIAIPKIERYRICIIPILTAFGIYIIIFLMTYLFSRLASKKIIDMITSFINFIKSDELFFNIDKFEPEHDNEFYDVFVKIKGLVTKINESRDKMDDLLVKNMNLQLKHAQSQINPHLLYNSLSNLKWECYKYDANIAKKIDALADYYRSSITKIDGNYTFFDELGLVKKYIEVISMIHNFKYKYDFEFDDETLRLETIQHVLQPFVENSILHGINRKDDGYIKISGHKTGNTFTIKITDNGYGMSREKLLELQTEVQTDRVGFTNTCRRIRLKYKNCNVNINSEESKGTELEIKFEV